MEDERVISYERGKQLADQLGLEFFETSAKENINVKVNQFVILYPDMLINQHETQFPILFWLIDQAVFERLVDIICDKMSESLDSDPNMVNSSKGTRLTDQTPAPNAGACQCWTPTNTHFPDPARQPKKIPPKIIRRHQQKKSVYKCGTSAIFQNDKKRNNFTIFFSPPNIPFVFQCWIISIITVSIQKKKKFSRGAYSFSYTMFLFERFYPRQLARMYCWWFRFILIWRHRHTS